MASVKWFRRRPRSPITPTMVSPTEQTYPLPSYISPTKSNMKPRDESLAACEGSHFESDEEYDVSTTESCSSLADTDTECSVSTRPSTPKRDSATLGYSYQEVMEVASGGCTPLLGEYENKRSSFRRKSSLPVTLPLLSLTGPDRTWHSVVAAWQIMAFTQRCRFDVAYVAHIYEDTSVKQRLALSKFQTRFDASLASEPLAGQLLAGYGLHRLSSPLELHVHERLLQDKYSEYRADTAGPDDLAYGQIYTFHRGIGRESESFHHDHPYFRLGRPDRRINRGIIFAAYRRTTSAEKLCENAVEQFVNDIIDVYLSNGLNSLLLDSRSQGAEILGRTTRS